MCASGAASLLDPQCFANLESDEFEATLEHSWPDAEEANLLADNGAEEPASSKGVEDGAEQRTRLGLSNGEETLGPVTSDVTAELHQRSRQFGTENDGFAPGGGLQQELSSVVSMATAMLHRGADSQEGSTAESNAGGGRSTSSDSNSRSGSRGGISATGSRGGGGSLGRTQAVHLEGELAAAGLPRIAIEVCSETGAARFICG